MSRVPVLLGFGLLFACRNGGTVDIEPVVTDDTGEVEATDDTGTEDCEPSDEVCDGEDNDCDGLVDEDAVDAETFYADADRDGFGDPDSWTISCQLPPDSTDNGLDCDDTDADVNPEAVEVCNDGVDDDCDGLADDDDPDLDAATTTSWFSDSDGDGYGEGEATAACVSPGSDWSTVDGDCDDLVDTVHPYAVEVCTDGVDNDCDDAVDEACTSTAEAELLVSGEGLDHFAEAVAIGDIDGDGQSDLLIGGPLDQHDDLDVGRVYAVKGPLTAGHRGISDAADQLLTGSESGSGFGHRLDLSQDLDGDGYDDLIVAAPRQTTTYGAVGVFLGPVSGTPDLEDADTLIEGWGADTQIGSGVVRGIEDHDGDGLPELLMGTDSASGGRGRIYLFSGITTGELSPSSASVVLTGGSTESGVGDNAATGEDFDGDGIADLAFGSDDKGRAWAFYGPVSRDADAQEADVLLGSEENGFGHDVAAGDLDGDGLADLVVSDPYSEVGASGAGVAFIFLGPLSASLDESTADARVEDSGDGVLLAKVDVEDLNGDARLDLLVVGAHDSRSVDYGGSMAAVLGPFSGTVSMDDGHVRIEGSEERTWLRGSEVGDLDGDEVPDLVLHSEERGEVYLFFGSSL